MLHVLDADDETLAGWLEEREFGAYRVGQLRSWLFARRAGCFDDMTDLPKSLRTELSGDFRIWSMREVQRRQADDGTEKLLLRTQDGGQIECVLLRDGHRRSVCISTQVGCAMGCVFCASGLDGVDRNLTTGEIIEQLLRLQRLLPTEERLSHIVVMGMGEPLANLDSLLPALDVASHRQGLGISSRRITISTVGLPAAMDRLSTARRQFHLAVSLHAPDDELRNRLVPVNRGIGLRSILSAAQRYFEASGRRLTFEYVLLRGVNDAPHHAAALARLLRGRAALLNLIPYNPVAGLPYKSPTTVAIKRFRDTLENNNIAVKVRKRKGDRIDAACGQLRRQVTTIEDGTAV